MNTTRKIIAPADMVATYKGTTYTGAQLIEQALEWRCRASGLGLAFLRFEAERQGKYNRFIVCQLPSGDEYTVMLAGWLKGSRPPANIMDSHIIKKESEAYGKFLKCGKRGTESTIQILLPSGEVYECLVKSWRKGSRPTQFAMNKHLYIQQAEDYGYRFLGWGKHGTSPTMKLLLPDGSIYECKVSTWHAGSRPDGCSNNPGCYNDTIFSRDENLRNTPGVLYYRKFVHPHAPTVFKIGIAKGETSKNRFRERDGDYTVTVLSEIQMPLYECFLEEQRIIKEYAQFKYVPNPPLTRGGNQECFSVDILELNVETAIERDEELAIAA